MINCQIGSSGTSCNRFEIYDTRPGDSGTSLSRVCL